MSAVGLSGVVWTGQLPSFSLFLQAGPINKEMLSLLNMWLNNIQDTYQCFTSFCIME